MTDRHYKRAPAGRDRRAGGRRALLLAALAVGCLALVATARDAYAWTLFEGTVVHITDAREFTVQALGGRRVTVTLGGTSLPAGRRAAATARRVLAEHLLNQPVRVQSAQEERVPLTATVIHEHADVAMQMVAAGWLGSDGSRPVLDELRDQARAARRGMWSGAGE